MRGNKMLVTLRGQRVNKRIQSADGGLSREGVY